MVFHEGQLAQKRLQQTKMAFRVSISVTVVLFTVCGNCDIPLTSGPSGKKLFSSNKVSWPSPKQRGRQIHAGIAVLRLSATTGTACTVYHSTTIHQGSIFAASAFRDDALTSSSLNHIAQKGYFDPVEELLFPVLPFQGTTSPTVCLCLSFVFFFFFLNMHCTTRPQSKPE